MSARKRGRSWPPGSHAGNQTKIVMCTTRDDIEDIAHVLTLGADDYVMKPFAREIMQDKLTMLFGYEVA